jgi:tRNA (guanine37-N1)-methyltransferase
MAKLKDLLKNKLTTKQFSLLPSSFDVIGDILIFSDFPEELKKKEKVIGEVLLSYHKNIKTILKKVKQFSGKYRLPKYKVIAGKRKKETTYKENNVKIKLNVEKVYFSPRLATERLRISELIKPNEIILVMFSGVAVYPLVFSKNSKTKVVYGIEINPIAHKYALENLKLNKVSNIKLYLGDVNKIIPYLNISFDRIVMPLPKGAGSFLDLALSKVKKKGIIHFYDFLDESKFDSAKEKIDKACKKANKKFKILNFVKCGQFSPYTYRVCVDFRVS